MKVYDIIRLLENTPSSNDKIAILNEHRDNEDLKNMCRLAADKSILFYQKKIPNYNVRTNNIPFSEAMKSLDALTQRKTTGNDAINYLTDIFECVGSKNAKMLERIIKKDLNCGISKATINKIWKELIKIFPVMKCDKENSKIVYPAMIQEKIDGMRITVIVNGKDVKFISANSGKIMWMCDHLKEEVLKLLGTESKLALDGEGLILENGEFLERKKGNGILTKCIKGTATIKDQSKVHLKVWDIIPLKDFYNKRCDIKCVTRYLKLKELFKGKNITKIHLTKTEKVNSYKEAILFVRKMFKNGKEGAILKNASSIWESKRSKEHVKFKEEYECDLRVIDIIPHKKRENCVGSLVCTSRCGKLLVNVGSGLTKKDIEKPFDYYMNKIIETNFNSIIDSEKKDTKSLNLPTFVEVKDKDEADSLKEIEVMIENSLKEL